MHNQYYVQEIARNYLKNIAGDPDALKVHASWRRGVEPEEYRDGFAALKALMENIYGDIISDPSAFGMLLKENIEADAKNADYTNSHASFVRVPHMLFLLGVNGTPEMEGLMAYEGQSLSAAAKELKITALPFLLGKLADYGFVIKGLGKTIKPGDRISVAFPDTPALTLVLKSMADAQLALNNGKMNHPKQYFYMLHSELTANEKPKAPKLTIKDFCWPLEAPQREIVNQLHAYVAAEAKAAVKMGGFMRNDWSCIYTGVKSKKVLMTLHLNQNHLSVKLNLQHIGAYVDKIGGYPPMMLETIRSGGWECGSCHGTCAGGFAFEMDGKSYNKCRCGSFVFEDIEADILPYCMELLKQELAV